MKANRNYSTIAVILVAYVLFVAASTATAQSKNVAVTVYNSDIALVKDVRRISIAKGESEISFNDVAARIDPTSVSFSSLSDPEGVSILEQNYEYDLVGSAKMFQKYVDQKIKISVADSKPVEGVLLSSSRSDVIIRLNNGEIKMFPIASVTDVTFPRLPNGLITRPTLVWKLYSERGKKQDVEVRYLTTGIKWHAEYIASIGKNDKELQLSSWVSIDNRSGASYDNALLKVVAGDVQRASRPEFRRRMEMDGLAMRAAPGGFEERSFFEYHIYELGRRTTLKNNQIKQIALFEPAIVEFDKIFEYESRRSQNKVFVKIEFDNKSEDGLGIPLPMGKVRIYKEDTDGSLEFAGEDFIDHTPKDERVSLIAGSAFDVKAEWIQTDVRKISDKKRRYSIQIKLRNHKKDDIVIRVIEHPNGVWKMRESSHEYEKVDARTIKMNVKVPSDSETVITYTYETQF